jgi:hypothetical protein
MPKLYIRLDAPDFDALLRLAQDKRRHPSDQAAVLLREKLFKGEKASLATTGAAGVAA